MIEINKFEEIIKKHKDCRHPHHVKGGVYLSCLVMVLAEVKEQNPIITAKELGVI